MTSLYEVQDDLVTVQTDDSSTAALRHASVKGRVLSGITREGERADVDLSRAHLQVRRLDVALTTVLVSSVSLLTLAAVVAPFVVMLLAPRAVPVFDGGSGGGSSGGTR